MTTFKATSSPNADNDDHCSIPSESENQRRNFKYHGLNKKNHQTAVLWFSILITVTFVLTVCLAVGLYRKASKNNLLSGYDAKFDNQTRQAQLLQQQQNNFIEIMAIQARNIKDLKQLVQQLAKKLQENNERILQNENNHKLLNSSTPNKNEIKFPELGWFNPWNGYQYRLTKNLGNWSSVRSECQSYGADLAAFGMRNFNTRRFIKNALQNIRLWIGLSDREIEGKWTWVDGKAAIKSEVFWLPGEPSGGIEDCGEIGIRNTYYVTNDAPCSFPKHGICEKRLY